MAPAGTGTTTSPTTPAAASLIYAVQANPLSSVIYVFPATATGTPSPVATLMLPASADPASLVTDSSGQIYVGCQCTNGDEVLVYASGATGNVVPSRAIAVPTAPFSIAVDTSGLLYVGGFAEDGTPRVYVYSANGTGSPAPLRTLSPSGIQLISALATDSSGNLYVAGETPNDSGSISIYAPGASGSAQPSRAIQSSFNFYGLTVDSSGDLFATTDGPDEVQLVEYSPSMSGTAAPAKTFSVPTPLPDTSNIGSVAEDAAGNFYFVASDTLSSSGTQSTTVTIYTLASGFNSTSIPIRTFTPPSSISLIIAVH